MESAHRQVVLVEGQDAVRQSLERALVFHGYKVTGVRTALAAQELLLVGMHDLLLNVIPLSRPDESIQLAQWARVGLPGLPIILVTGLQAPTIPASMRDDALIRQLAKPFGMSKLITTMAALIDAAIVLRTKRQV